MGRGLDNIQLEVGSNRLNIFQVGFDTLNNFNIF